MIDFGCRRSDLLRRLMRRTATIVPLSWLPLQRLPHIDQGFYRLTHGRTTFSALISGLPIIMLTTIGARSGEPRTVPVLGLPEGDRLVVIGSNFGKPHHPGWYHNLRANPQVTVTWKGAAIPMQARELAGEERQRYVVRALQAYPWWEPYLLGPVPRQVPVIMLEPSR